MRTTRNTGRGLVLALACALLTILLLAAGAFAQVTTSGRLAGTVTDAQGAVVSNAQINVKNNETQTLFTATTNKEGGWTLPSVSPGAYTVTVTAAGFKTTIVQDVKVDVGQPTTVNATLETGAVNDQVVVTGGGEILQTASANVSSTITGRQIHELPFTTRDACSWCWVCPACKRPARHAPLQSMGCRRLRLTSASTAPTFRITSSSRPTVSSPRPRRNQTRSRKSPSRPPPPALRAPAGARCKIRFVTKRGSNEFHGGVFWQHRNDALNANYYFNQPAFDNLPRDRMRLNQFGGNIGGPIIIPKLFNGRDKAFFFVNYEEFTSAADLRRLAHGADRKARCRGSSDIRIRAAPSGRSISFSLRWRRDGRRRTGLIHTRLTRRLRRRSIID